MTVSISGVAADRAFQGAACVRERESPPASDDKILRRLAASSVQNSPARDFLPTAPILAVPQNSVKKMRLRRNGRRRTVAVGRTLTPMPWTAQLFGKLLTRW